MRKIIAAVAALILVVLGGIAYASIPAADGTINGCYKTGNPNPGSVIVVDSAASCPNGYTALNWPSSRPAVALVTNSQQVQAGNVSILATCASGSGVVGGGFATDDPAFVSRTNRPAISGGTTYNAWNAGGTASQGATFTVYALCMSGVTPAS